MLFQPLSLLFVPPNSVGMINADDELLKSEKILAHQIKLPAPQLDLEFPLMKALEQRRSIRKWKDTPLSEQEISNLLWAACGITQSGYSKAKSKRTAPSACNSQEIRVYLLMEKGVFLYQEENHELIEILPLDIREHTGTQKMMKTAPLGIVFVADLSRMTGPFLKSKEAKRLSAWVDTGFISQNVYLYCAAANLGSVVLGLVDRDKLHELMQLKEHEKIVLTQVVGHLA
ncbi:MAG: SagB/ThcOx family dehydrogenase [Calditrichaeota bacterium]|nr:MAG: SagB/ThcOx family dehydrogenase [Calditrichota bacterium]